jgi:hypothetical protein
MKIIKKIKMSNKLLNYFLNELVYELFAEKIARYPFCKKLSIKFYKKSKMSKIKGMRELFKHYPEIEKHYDEPNANQKIILNLQTGHIVSEKEQSNGAE